MHTRLLNLRSTRFLLLSAATFAAAAALTGCGIGVADRASTSEAMPLPAIGGRVFGGSIPIKHSRVFLYASGVGATPSASDGYGKAHLIEEANPIYASADGSYQGDTDAGGNFQFNAAGYTCPANEYLYAVSSGGNTADGDDDASFETNALLVSAIGNCTILSQYNFIFMNELTTVAAGYALGNFMTITNDNTNHPYPTVNDGNGSGSAAAGYNGTANGNGYTYVAPWTVGIGATITNAAPYGCYTSTSCDSSYEGYIAAANTAGATLSTAPLAAGLPHAFVNANDLVPFYLNQGANNSLPNNSAARVPGQLLNTLADIVAACVETPTGTQATSTPCQNLYKATGLEAGSTLSGTANSLQAMVNLAATPILQNGVTAATFLSSFTQASGFFQPVLTTGPLDNDWSVAIDFPKTMGATTGFQGLNYTYSGALDINDVYYLANDKGNQTTPSNLVSIGSDGTLLGYIPDQTTYIFQGVAADALGNVWSGNNSVSSAVGQTGAVRYPVTNGTFGTVTAITTGTAAFGSSNNPYSIAVDRGNNLWLGTSSATLSDVWEAPQGSSLLTAFANYSTKVYGIAVDPKQNIWVDNYTSGGAVVVQNTAAVGATPTYTSTSTVSNTGGALPYNFMFVANSTGGATEPYDAYVGRYTVAGGVEKFAVTQTAPKVTGLAASAGPGGGTASTLENGSADGKGQLFIADIAGGSSTAAALYVSRTLTTFFEVNPCLPVAAGNTTCGRVMAAARNAVVDSAGSVYITGSTGGNVIEIIGIAAPTWQLSLGQLGRP